MLTDVGAKAHEAPIGKNPVQVKDTDPLNAAFAVTVRVTDPVPPWTRTVSLEEVIVNAGGGKLIT
jgi:hypothetical protein